MTAHIWAADQPYFMSGAAPIVVTPPSITPSSPTLASTLSINLGTIDFAATVSVQWLLEGAPIPGAIDMTLSALSLAVGNLVSVEVTSASVTGATSVQVSAPVVISLT